MRGLTKVVAPAALLWGAGYLSWRALATSDEAALVTWITLLLAEILVFAVFCLRTWHAWPTSRPSPPHLVGPAATIVIDATSEPVGDVRTTLVAVRAMAGRPRAIIVDQRGNRWLRTVAERLGAVVLDRHVDLDAAIGTVATEWVLYLRPGDVPVCDLIERVAPRCRDDHAVIQLTVKDLDPTPLDDGPGPMSSVDAFESQVMRPALAARMTVPWYGDSPALIRRHVIGAVGGVGQPVDGVAEEADRWWRTGIRLVEAGERVSATPDVLVEAQTPRTLEERLQLRRDVAARRIRTLGGPDRPSRFGWRVGAAHAAPALIPVIGATGRLLQVATLVMVLGFGQVPMAVTAGELGVLAAPSYLLRWSAHLLLGQGRLGPLSLLRAELRSLGADLASVLPSSARSRPPRQRLLILLLILLGGAVGTCVFALWRDWDGHLPGPTALAALTLASVLIGVSTAVVVDSFTAVQRRAHRRVRLGMVTCRVEEHDGFLVDLSSGGVGVALPDSGNSGPAPGSLTTLSFRVPVEYGQWRDISTVVHVVHSRPDVDGGVRLGLEFDDPTAAPLDAVVEFLTSGPPRHFARA